MKKKQVRIKFTYSGGAKERMTKLAEYWESEKANLLNRAINRLVFECKLEIIE